MVNRTGRGHVRCWLRLTNLSPATGMLLHGALKACSMAKGKALLEQCGSWSQAANAYRQVLDAATDLQEAKTGLAVAELIPRLEDEAVAPQVMDRLEQLGSDAVSSLIALSKADFEAQKPPFSALHLHSLRQRRVSVLAQMADKEAVEYLRTLTPGGMVFIPAGPFIMGSDKE